MCVFYFNFLLGNSAYASQLLICVTIKEEIQSKIVLLCGIEPLIDMLILGGIEPQPK